VKRKPDGLNYLSEIVKNFNFNLNFLVMAKLTLNRKGRIDTAATSDNQCKDKGWGKYAYHVAITVDDDQLDENEFIMDNSIVHNAAQDCFRHGVSSCEGMVKKVAEALYEIATEYGLVPYRIYVMVRPRGVEEDSFAWFEYERDYTQEPETCYWQPRLQKVAETPPLWHPSF
jgi:hypothetical protein